MKQVAIVTGANRGIGKEIAIQLANKQIHVILAVRDEGKGLATKKELETIGLEVDVVVADMINRESIQSAVQIIEKKYGRLDILVNNAGVIFDRGISVLDVEDEKVLSTMNTNLLGPLRFIQAAVPLMKKHRYGRIINISSGLGGFDILQGLLGLKGKSSAYRISKTALNALTCLIAQEVEEWGISVNAVCPGQVRTDMGGKDAPSSVQEGADTAVWLASHPDSKVTGKFFRDRQQIAW